MAILSLNGARLHTATQLLTRPQENKLLHRCIKMHYFSELKYKTGRVIFELRRQLWLLEQQLRDHASNPGSMSLQPCNPWELAVFGGGYPGMEATLRRGAQAGHKGSQILFQFA